ncbi:MAG: type III-B CRISPR module RAMP protein Cmr1 [Nitrospirota bacterium]
MLKKITFEIETITPMFLAGAEQGKAELRAASIKGLLRFWWRAVRSQSSIETLRNEEAKIFGSSDEDVGGARFTIRVTQPDKEPLPDFKKEIPDINNPVRYLLYSTVMNKRPYFPVGSKFKILLSSRDENVLKIASASLWVLVYLGGLGTRSRRGAGNVSITSLDDPDKILSSAGIDFIPSEELVGWLRDNFEATKRLIAAEKSGFVSEYSNMSISRVVISNSAFQDWKKALQEIGGIFKEFRREKKVINRAVLGLPLKTVTARAGNDDITRRCSPIIIKLLKAGTDYRWIVLRLAGEFLPEGGVIADGRGASQKPDYGIIDEFWAELKNKGQEHILSMPDTLKAITDKIKKGADPQKIILFGSKARGDFHSRSDTDIAVESDKPGGLSLNGAIDIVDLKKADDRLKEKINKEGVVIYERKG